MVKFLLVSYVVNLCWLAHLTANHWLILEPILHVDWILKYDWLKIEVLVLISDWVDWYLVLQLASFSLMI